MTSPRRLRSGPPELWGSDCCVGLNHVVRASIRDVERPLHRANHADGDRPPLTERVADGDHPIAGRHLRGVAEFGFRQQLTRFFRQLDERAICIGVTANHSRLVLLVGFFSEQRNLDLGGPFNDMVVREDQAVFVDDEAGSCRNRGLFPTAQVAALRRIVLIAGARLAEESPEKVVGIRARPPKKSWRSCVRCRISVRMLTTMGDSAFAMLRNVCASMRR